MGPMWKTQKEFNAYIVCPTLIFYFFYFFRDFIFKKKKFNCYMRQGKLWHAHCFYMSKRNWQSYSCVPYGTLLKKCLFHFFLTLYCTNSSLRKIGSFRLPTHSRDAHRKFFWWSRLKLKSKFWLNVLYMAR